MGYKDNGVTSATNLLLFFSTLEAVLITTTFQTFVISNFIDNEFKTKSESNFSVSATGVDTAVASVSTRTIQDVQATASQLYLNVDVPPEFRIDASPFIDRPYFIGSFDWTNLDAQFSIVGPLAVRQLPGDVLRSNLSLLNAMKIGSYYRSDLTLQISVAGTISHAGTLLVGVLPPMSVPIPNVTQRPLINTILSGPHAFLAANEATSISMEVPWYCNSDLATLDMEKPSANYVPSGDITVTNGNYATLVFLVLNPLAPSQGASTSVTVTIDAAFKHLDILVPTPRYVAYTQSGLLQTLVGSASAAVDAGASFVKGATGDFIDKMRTAIKDYTGLHNPNDSSIESRVVLTNRNFLNTIDDSQYFEVLDPNPSVLRTVDRPLFGTKVDEMAISHIVSKPQYLGYFRVKSSTAVGALCWARPISPYQGGLDAEHMTIANNIELLHRVTRAWRGSIKITIQSVMNNKQQVKLRLLQLYNPSLAILTGYPNYASILNAPSHLMEFTAGNQTQEVVLPYLCRNHICPNMREPSSEALFHGEYYIYVASRLANADGSPEDVNFNVYITLMPDFTFYGYATELNDVASPVTAPAGAKLLASVQSLDVMNEPQKQNSLTTHRDDSTSHSYDRLMPLYDLRPVLRRMTLLESAVVRVQPDETQFVVVDVANLYHQKANTVAFTSLTPAQLVNSMFYGRTGGIKMSVTVHFTWDEPNAELPDVKNHSNLEVSFVPPNYFVDAPTGTFRNCLIATSGLAKFSNSTQQFFPVPYTVSQSSNTFTYEFKVPDTGIYKYIGAPTQLLPGPNNNLSTLGLGYIVLGFTSPLAPKSKRCAYTISFAYTDEMRAGFHAIAPYIRVPEDPEDNTRIFTPYFGTPANPTVLPLQARNKYIYFQLT